MRHLIRAIFIPAVVTLTLTAASRWFGRTYIPLMIGTRDIGPVVMILEFPYLLGLVLVGAAGAFWSSHAGGRVRDRVVAALAPALWQAVAVAAMEAKEAMVAGPPWNRVASAFVDRAILPGVALILGALPFLFRPTSSARKSVSAV